MSSACLICGAPVKLTGYQDYDCERCGSYRLPSVAARMLELGPLSKKQGANGSAWIRENPGVMIMPDTLDRIRELRPPPVGERAEELLQFLARKYPEIGLSISFPSNQKQLGPWLSASWSENMDEVRYLIENYLTQTKRFLQQVGAGGIGSHHKIAPEGWSFLDALQRSNKGSKLVFVAMSFKPVFTPLYEKGIEPAVKAAGYEPRRVDRTEHVNPIDDEIIALINRSRFLIADFTDQNQGVYYEAGYAHGLGLKVFCSCRKDQIDPKEGKDPRLHFDIRQYPMVEWVESDLEDYQRRLKNRIEANMR